MRKMYELIDSNKPFIGAFCQIPSVEVAEMFCYAGMDFIIVDLEHGYHDKRTTLEMIRAIENAGAVPMIRVHDVNEDAIKKAFDMGASAIAVPGVRCYEDALKVVEYAKFKPMGNRGACPGVRANRYGMDDHVSFFQQQNKETKIFVGLEGPSAIADLDKIVKIEGIDILGVGPIDLSVSLGCNGAITDEVKAESLRVKKEANKNGKLYASFYEYVEDIPEDEEDVDLYLVGGIEFELAKFMNSMAANIKKILKK